MVGEGLSGGGRFSGPSFLYSSDICRGPPSSPGTSQLLSLAPTKGLFSPVETTGPYFCGSPSRVLNDCVIGEERRHQRERHVRNQTLGCCLCSTAL